MPAYTHTIYAHASPTVFVKKDWLTFIMTTTRAIISAVAAGEAAITGNDVTEREIEIHFFSGLKKSKTKQPCEFCCGGRNSHKIKVSWNMSKIVIGSSFPTINSCLFMLTGWQRGILCRRWKDGRQKSSVFLRTVCLMTAILKREYTNRHFCSTFHWQDALNVCANMASGLFSSLCVGTGKSIWKYLIHHVFQQR